MPVQVRDAALERIIRASASVEGNENTVEKWERKMRSFSVVEFPIRTGQVADRTMMLGMLRTLGCCLVSEQAQQFAEFAVFLHLIN